MASIITTPLASISAIEPALADSRPPNHSLGAGGPWYPTAVAKALTTGARYTWLFARGRSREMPLPSACTASPLTCTNFEAGEKPIPVPASDTSTPDLWSNLSGAARPTPRAARARPWGCPADVCDLHEFLLCAGTRGQC